MKYLVKIFVVTFFISISTYSLAEQNIAYLDLKYVLNNSSAGKGAQDYLKDMFKENQKKFSDREKKLKKSETDLLAQKSVIEKEEYQKKADNLRKEVSKYKSERRKSLDSITTKRAKARETLLDKINPIIDEYALENNITIILDKNVVLMGNKDTDITKNIIDRLNKKLPSISLK